MNEGPQSIPVTRRFPAHALLACALAHLGLLANTAQAQDDFVRLEAESMVLDGFRTENVSGSSNGALINLKGRATSGSATTTFDGSSGAYDIFVGYHDEQDGDSSLAVDIAGARVDTWPLSNSPGGTQPGAGNFLIRQIAMGRTINNGDTIEIIGTQDVWDNANVDYIEFVRSGAGGPGASTALPVARVAPSGADYASVRDALDNIDSGDRWCRDPVDDERPGMGCVVVIAAGEYIEPRLNVPDKVSLVGAGADVTILSAEPGTVTAVSLSADTEAGAEMVLRDLTIANGTGNGTDAFGIVTNAGALANIENVHVRASGSARNIAVFETDESGTRYRNVQLSANGGDNAIALQAQASTDIVGCEIYASGATSNIGIRVNPESSEDGDLLSVRDCLIVTTGGQSATGIDFSAPDAHVDIAHSRIRVQLASATNTGIEGRRPGISIAADNVHIDSAQSGGSAVNTAVSYAPGIGSGSADRFSRVRALAGGGLTNRGMVLVGPLDGRPIVIVDSALNGGTGTAQHVGLAIESAGTADVRIDRSTLSGDTAALSLDAINTDGRIGIGASQIIGGLSVPATVTDEVRCAGVYDQDYNFFGGTCPP